MSERDYLLVQSLTRLRAAQDLVRASHVNSVVPGVGDEVVATLVCLERWIEALEAKVEEARESHDEGS